MAAATEGRSAILRGSLNLLPAARKAPSRDLRLALGSETLWARLTARSCHELQLAPGAEVFALIKAVALDRHSLGRRASRARFLEN